MGVDEEGHDDQRKRKIGDYLSIDRSDSATKKSGRKVFDEMPERDFELCLANSFEFLCSG